MDASNRDISGCKLPLNSVEVFFTFDKIPLMAKGTAQDSEFILGQRSTDEGSERPRF